jgi:hypothetical protein
MKAAEPFLFQSGVQGEINVKKMISIICLAFLTSDQEPQSLVPTILA